MSFQNPGSFLSSPVLSIIIPAHNEQHRLPPALENLYAYLQQQAYSFEILVVENGSSDDTLALAQEFAQCHNQVRVLHESRRGKGLAVKRGMLESRGEYRFMCDVDFSMPIDQINRFFPPLLTGADIAIASREAPGAVRYGEPEYRHLVGRVFNWMIRWMVLPGLHDTQCGFKCFRAQAAEDLFRSQRLTGWSFDVEVLFIARQRGYRIVEVPVPWYFNPDTKVRLIKDSLRMFAELVTIRWNAVRGWYASPSQKA